MKGSRGGGRGGGRNRGRGRPEGGRRRSAAPVLETVEIQSIAAGGEGVARLPDGRVLFVHRTAPGDVAEVSITMARERWARGRMVRIVSASPNRRHAPCPYYASCGGCTLEHMEYPAQLEAKGRIVADALGRIGGRRVGAVPVEPSPAEFRYRNRVSFTLRRRGASRVVAGFHRLGAPDEIVDMDGRCLLPEEPISRAWDELRAGWGHDASLLPAGPELRLTLRATAAGEVSLLVEGGVAAGRPEALLEAVPSLASVWHAPDGGEPGLVAGAPALRESWGDESVEVGGAAFLQVNREAARRLEDHVIRAAGDVNGLRVVDAYCGVGFHAWRLARAGAEVVGIELNADAITAARREDVPRASFLEGSVEALLPGALPADLVILNPPRAGISPEVIDALRAAPPGRLIYVSCNPATLARDLQRLGEGFRIESVHAFDLFPQTAHVETVAVLRAEDDPKPNDRASEPSSPAPVEAS